MKFHHICPPRNIFMVTSRKIHYWHPWQLSFRCAWFGM